MSRLNQQFQLTGGRRLGYDERGATDGRPVFYFHGSPSSRIEAALYLSDDLLESCNIRLIALDRPGLGLSDFQPDRRLLDWPRDVLALADHLKIERFTILAYSLGGPYGLACAFAIPQRLEKAGIVSGAAMFTEPDLVKNINEGTRKFLTMPRDKPWLARLFLWIVMGVMPRIAPHRFVAQANSLLPAPDRRIVTDDQEFQKGFLRMVTGSDEAGNTRGVP